MNTGYAYGTAKYEVVESPTIEVGHVLEHTQVSPILKVEDDGLLRDFEGNAFKIVNVETPSNEEDGGNPLLYALLVIIIVLGSIFLTNRKKT